MQRIGPKRRNWVKIVFGTVGLLALVGSVVAGYLFFTQSTSPLPPEIRSDITFSPFVLPTNAKDHATSGYKFSRTENNVQILSYIVHTKNDKSITISEYPQPQEFTEVPEYKERFLSNVAKQYETVQTSNGTIYLGRMALQDNKQLGVMLERGLVVFLNPSKELSPAEWRSIGDQLEIQKVIN